jgi:hypothetical protein
MTATVPQVYALAGRMPDRFRVWRPTAFVDTGIIPRTAIPCQILDTSCVQPRTV